MADNEHEERMATPRMAAGALFFDGQDQVLLVKPSYKPKWEIPGGYIERGESPLTTCRREVQEKRGRLSQHTRVRTLRPSPDGRRTLAAPSTRHLRWKCVRSSGSHMLRIWRSTVMRAPIASTATMWRGHCSPRVARRSSVTSQSAQRTRAPAGGNSRTPCGPATPFASRIGPA
ncbi:NUDIX domain-containing protein [Streptomyces sp. YGL11-2]|uniref:NUDIX domain-containing protein n=1 Tax=Streptomyces sp. YGL11-2 TaxID=3414028 RepID=UPI003CEC21B6